VRAPVTLAVAAFGEHKKSQHEDESELRLNLRHSRMKYLLTAFAIALATSAMLMTSAMAQKIGVSLAYSDDLFLTTLREAMEKRVKELGVNRPP
jgi:hypothetical protein